MAGGLGARLFVAGDVITAADVNGYLMNQSMMRFATTGARDTAFGNGIAVGQTVSGVAGDGKPLLQEGMFAYIDFNNDVQFFNGSTWVSAPTFVLADGDVTAAKLASAVAGNGLSGGAGTALAVNVDDSTVEINSDTLRVKDLGITSAKLGSGLSLTGTTKIEEIFEKGIINTTTHPSTGSPLTLDIADGAVYYYTTPCPHGFTLNITATGMVVNQALTLVFAMTSSATSGKVSLITVNNTTPASVKWFGGNQYPAGSGGNAVDVYTITIFKYLLSGVDTLHVFASQSKFA